MPITANPTTENNLSVPIIRKIWGSHRAGTQANTTASAMVTYQVKWSDQWTFLQEINGIFNGVDSNGHPVTTYRLPMQFADFPSLLVRNCGNARGLGPGTGCNSPYKYALIDVEFATPQYQVSGSETMLSIEYDADGQFLTAPGGVYSFDDGTVADTGIGIFVPSTSISLTRYRVPVVDTSTFESLQGKVNSTEFFGRAEGTVLCSPIRTSSQQEFGGMILNTVTYTFAWRSIPWNQFLNPKTGIFGPVSPAPYTEADLNQLFNS